MLDFEKYDFGSKKEKWKLMVFCLWLFFEAIGVEAYITDGPDVGVRQKIILMVFVRFPMCKKRIERSSHATPKTMEDLPLLWDKHGNIQLMG